VKDFFETTQADAASAYLYATPDDKGAKTTDVYYGANGIYGAGILHETLHHFLGLTDTDIHNRLGIDKATRESRGTLAITDVLAKEGCK
jgi:hypothetical protein